MPLVIDGAENVNLIVSAASAPGSAAAGASVAVSYTVENEGTDIATADWQDAVYLSNSPTVNAYSTLLDITDETSQAPLSGGNSYTVNENVDLSSYYQSSNASINPGNHYLVFVANGQGGVNSYTGSSYAVPISITAPDLAVTAASFTGSSVEGGSINVHWTVQNLGTADATGSWYDTVYLSDSPVLGAASQIELGTSYNYSGLAAGSTYTANQTFTVPAMTIGDRYLLVVADDPTFTYGHVADSNPTNNVEALPITLTAPNLAVSNVTVQPGTAEVGNAATVTVGWQVTNDSSVNAVSGWTDAVYLSTTPDFSLNTATLLTTESSKSTLAAGASYSSSASNLSIPNLAAGSYYILVVANVGYVDKLLGLYSYYAMQPESAYEDNFDLTPLALTTPAVNLTVSQPSVASTSLVINQPVNYSFHVNNQGSETASANWSDAIYISQSSTFSQSSATEITTLGSQGPLAAGSSYVQSGSFRFPGYELAGTYYVYFVTNYGQYQGESDYEDDVSTPLEVTLNVPSVSIAADNPPSTVALGQTVQLSWTGTNSSSYPAYGYWYDYVYLSSTPTYSYGTSTYLTYAYVNYQSTPLAAGGTYSESPNVSIPSFATGSEYLLFVDGFNGSVDAVPVTVTAPHLTISSVSATPAVVEAGNGATMNLSWTVTNDSTVNATDTWTDSVYLSSSSIFDNSATLLTEAYSQSPLAAGSSYTTNLSNVVVPNEPAGTYYVYFLADDPTDYDHQPETNTTGNLSSPVQITLTAPQVELQMTPSASNPNDFSAGSFVQMSWSVKNVGTETASSTWTDDIYWSAQSTFNLATATELSDSPVGLNAPLAAGSSYANSSYISIPNNVARHLLPLLRGERQRRSKRVEQCSRRGRRAGDAVRARPDRRRIRQRQSARRSCQRGA